MATRQAKAKTKAQRSRWGTRKWLGPTVASVACLLAWYFLTAIFAIPSYILPDPHSVYEVSVEYKPELIEGTWVTLLEIAEGFVIAVLVSLPLAAVIVMSKTVSQVLYPLLVIFQTVPKIALAPLFVVWFGFGSLPKIIVTLLICFFPILLDAITGLRSADPELKDLLSSMGASRTQVFFRLLLPTSLPAVFSGLKVSITLAVAGAVVAEFVGSDKGLGYLLLWANSNLLTSLLFAAIIVLTVLGLLMYALIGLIERWMIPWHVSQRKTVGQVVQFMA